MTLAGNMCENRMIIISYNFFDGLSTLISISNKKLKEEEEEQKKIKG